MYRRSLTVVAVASLTLAGLGVSAFADERPDAASRPAVSEPDGVSRGLIVRTTTKTPSDSLLEEADKALGATADVAADDVLTTKVSTVDFDEPVPTSVAAAAAAAIEKRSDVEWAVPNARRTTSAVPPVTVDDHYFGSQRNLWDSVTTSPAGGYSIKAPSLWRKTMGSGDVRVAVVDTGVTSHPELEGQLVAGYDMIDDASSSNDGNGRDSDPSDPGDWAASGYCGSGAPEQQSSWHGTFVAGQIAARTDDDPSTDNYNPGIAGIAPRVKIQPVRVLGQCGGWDEDILAGMIWASGGHVDGVPDNDKRSQVVNLSLGGNAETKAERDAACVAYNEVAAAGRARGSVFVAAAGNEFGDADLAIPALCSQLVSVGATSNRGFSSSYSNIGSTVDLSAPGGDTLVEGANDSILSLVDSGARGPVSPTYARYDGTSAAAPEVSAGAALLYSLGLSMPDDVQNALYASVAPFRARSSSYAEKKVIIDGHAYYLDLNCSGHTGCGRGILDLSRVEVPISAPTISGTVRIGEPLTASLGSWVKTPVDPYYIWKRDGETVGTAKVYHPTNRDEGKTLTVTIQPRTAAFAPFASTSEETIAVPAGPDVSISQNLTPITYGTPFTTRVEVIGEGDEIIENGTVQIRRADGTILATGTTETVPPEDGQPSRGVANIEIPGTGWKPGFDLLRAEYVGQGVTPAASSQEQFFDIRKVTPSVTISLASSVNHRSHAKLYVVVKAAQITNPTGGIKVYDGSRRIVSTSLSSSGHGKKTITMPLLKRGRHSIKVVYGGNTYILGRISNTRRITSK